MFCILGESDALQQALSLQICIAGSHLDLSLTS